MHNHSIPLSVLPQNSILYRGGLVGADRGLRVGYRDAECLTGHHAAPYIQQHAPANARAPDAADRGTHEQQASKQSFPPREIGSLMAPREAAVRKTPAGFGGAPRNPSPLGAPLDAIQVPSAPSWMSVDGARLLYALQHALPPVFHRLSSRFNKRDFFKVVRETGVQHRWLEASYSSSLRLHTLVV